MEGEKEKKDSKELANVVHTIKEAILQSQQRALTVINQEQLALYYRIGQFVSLNTRNRNWGKGFIEAISEQLRKELPGLRGFSSASLRKMRTFYEEWQMLSDNSFVSTNEFNDEEVAMSLEKIMAYCNFCVIIIL